MIKIWDSPNTVYTYHRTCILIHNKFRISNEYFIKMAILAAIALQVYCT